MATGRIRPRRKKQAPNQQRHPKCALPHLLQAIRTTRDKRVPTTPRKRPTTIATTCKNTEKTHPVSNVGGGTWDRGIVAERVYSNYLHNSRCHGSTAVGKTTVRTANIAAGYWARATADRAIGNNQAYRRTC